MDLEVKDLTTDKQKYKTRVKSYQVELSKLETDVVSYLLFYLFDFFQTLLNPCYDTVNLYF